MPPGVRSPDPMVTPWRPSGACRLATPGAVDLEGKVAELALWLVVHDAQQARLAPQLLERNGLAVLVEDAGGLVDVDLGVPLPDVPLNVAARDVGAGGEQHLGRAGAGCGTKHDDGQEHG